MNLYMRVLAYVKPYKGKLAISLICTIFASLANLYVPWIIKDVIDDVLTQKHMWLLNMIAIGIIALYIFRGIFFFGQTYLMSYVGQKVIIDIRQDLYNHIQAMSIPYFERRQTGELMSNVTNDVGALQGALVDSVVEFVTEATILVGSIFYMFYIDWRLSLLTFMTLPAVAQIINVFGKKLRVAGRIMQERSADITSVLQETISSIRIIKSFVREDYEKERFAKENDRNFMAQMYATKLTAMLTPLIEFLAAIGVTLIIWFGGMQVIDGHLTSGALIAFLIYAVNLSNPVKRLSRVYANIQRSMGAAKRVFDIMDTLPEIKELPDAKDLPKIKGDVTFDRLSFSYNDTEVVLSELTLEAKSGQMIAIVGPSGAGKTTIASLIPRFYDPYEGSIKVDGVDIKTVTLDSLRKQVGIVPQETVLFHGSIYDNILYGDLNADREQVLSAAQAANAHNFIEELPNGYDTQIGERGCRLSGGQRQRIAIARAILKNPRILILDEATSALDAESERLVQDALDHLMLGRTSFVIAHRLSTVQRADKIVVLDKGLLQEQGSHEELLAKRGLYSKLYNSQFRDSAESDETLSADMLV